MKKLLPIPIILIVIFVVFSLLLPNMAVQFVKKKQQLTLLRLKEQEIPSLSATLATKSEQLATLREVFPEKKDFDLVAGAIDNLAARSQVAASLHFESEELVQNEQGDFVSPVTITAEGDYDKIFTFLQGLSGGKYLFAITSLEGDSTTGIKNKNKLIIRGVLYATNK